MQKGQFALKSSKLINKATLRPDSLPRKIEGDSTNLVPRRRERTLEQGTQSGRKVNNGSLLSRGRKREDPGNEVAPTPELCVTDEC